MCNFIRRYLLIVLLFACACASPVLAQKKMSASEAKDHFGEMATVCGEVVSARYASTSNGEPTFLNFDKSYPNQIFTVVIWGENRNKFGKPEEDYQGKRICVTGKITAYAGLPEIVVADPKQISADSGKLATLP
jgi:micrococcal nuclease